MKKECYIYLFRHGQTSFNKNSMFTGWLNPGLTMLGKKQAIKIAKKLRNKKIDLAIQTKLKRSKDTLKIILKDHKECKKILEDNRMIERNYGSLNGTKHEDFIKNQGINEFNLIHRGFQKRPPRGESFADVEKRIKPFIKDLLLIMKKRKINVAISAHGNSIRLFRKIMEKASIKETCSWKIPYDSFYEYKIKV